MPTIDELFRREDFTAADLLECVCAFAPGPERAFPGDMAGWNSNLDTLIDRLIRREQPLDDLIAGWRTVAPPTQGALGVSLARRGHVAGSELGDEVFEAALEAELRSWEGIRGLASLWPAERWLAGILERASIGKSIDARVVGRYIEQIQDPETLLRFAYIGRPTLETWQVLEARLEDLRPVVIAEAEARLAAGPESWPPYNDGQRPILGTLLGLLAVRSGQTPDLRYDPLLALSCDEVPERSDSSGDANERFLELVAEIVRALPVERRERLVIQDRYQNRKLMWSLAIESDTLTPEVARRAAWKIADQGRRENTGGIWTSPRLRRFQAAIFPALGDVAVPELVREYDGGARRRDFVVEALGLTLAPAAARPLVEILGAGAATLQKSARAGLQKIVAAGHADAVLDAARALISGKTAARMGAACALALIPEHPEAGRLVREALAGERAAKVRAALETAVAACAEAAEG